MPPTLLLVASWAPRTRRCGWLDRMVRARKASILGAFHWAMKATALLSRSFNSELVHSRHQPHRDGCRDKCFCALTMKTTLRYYRIIFTAAIRSTPFTRPLRLDYSTGARVSRRPPPKPDVCVQITPPEEVVVFGESGAPLERPKLVQRWPTTEESKPS
jgi:hypothetical protein